MLLSPKAVICIFHRFSGCRLLLRKMLSYEADNRPSIHNIRKSDWMCKPIHDAGKSSVSSMSVAAGTKSLLKVFSYHLLMSNLSLIVLIESN